jgi:hypothetical protein
MIGPSDPERPEAFRSLSVESSCALCYVSKSGESVTNVSILVVGGCGWLPYLQYQLYKFESELRREDVLSNLVFPDLEEKVLQHQNGDI